MENIDIPSSVGCRDANETQDEICLSLLIKATYSACY